MLLPLFDDERVTLKRIAVMMCGAAIAIMPFASGASSSASAAGVLPVRALAALALPSPDTVKPIRVERDPFVSEMALPNENLPGPADAYDTSGIVLPPNSGAVGMPVGVGAQSVVVRAVALGKQSRALVESGGTVRVLGVGDIINGSAIVRIDALGIELADGTHAPLMDGPK